MTHDGRVLGQTLVASAVTAAVSAYYLASMVWWKGQTLGGRALGIRVLSITGDVLTYRQAVLRLSARYAAAYAGRRTAARGTPFDAVFLFACERPRAASERRPPLIRRLGVPHARRCMIAFGFRRRSGGRAPQKVPGDVDVPVGEGRGPVAA